MALVAETMFFAPYPESSMTAVKPTSRSERSPLIIGVVGGSGSGKTTVSRAILDATGLATAFIDADAYYKDLAHLTLEERKQVNFDHPDALDNDLLVVST